MNKYYKMNYDYLNNLKPRTSIFSFVVTIDILVLILFIIISL